MPAGIVELIQSASTRSIDRQTDFHIAICIFRALRSNLLLEQVRAPSLKRETVVAPKSRAPACASRGNGLSPKELGFMPQDQEYKLSDFLPSWLQDYLRNLPSSERERFLAEFDAGVQELLKSLAILPLNQVPDGTERGKLSLRIPGTTRTFINLKLSLWAFAKYGGPLLLASSLAAPLVGSLGIAIAAPQILSTIGSAAAALYQAVAKLNAIEMDTYLAVAAAIDRNNNQGVKPASASLEQILKSFRLDKKNLEKPHDLAAMLSGLVAKHVLVNDVSTGTDRYSLAF
jgi:hypothetical protein